MDAIDAMGLKGVQLDYWVACAERENGHAESDIVPTPPPAFSSDHTLGNAIIDREGIAVVLAVDAEFGNQYVAGVGPANPYGFPNTADGLWMGDGKLEAAMRCYVGRTFANFVRSESPITTPLGNGDRREHESGDAR